MSLKQFHIRVLGLDKTSVIISTPDPDSRDHQTASTPRIYL
ncbi:hypothetical protein HMPREF1549_02313 [Actinomyces johnsonii F0510]|uniref:Uncharacterized protein n=1 Tax=Actinomyces johnsonii F0510 TaxID=1227262 RepID=U1PNY2_9ACTO|nr:hypothetical protein HMPREF1549_02313 [Actinomyces johnsonii F0510]